MNTYTSAVKLHKTDMIAKAYRCNNEIQSYLDQLLLNNIDRNIKDGILDKQEEVLNTLLIAKDEMNITEEEICEIRVNKHS